VPRDASFNVDAAAVITKISELGRCIVYLASPNNPTGNCLNKADFLAICAADCVVVVDEAYAEFSQASLYEPSSLHDNVIFCRTFSKWAALAGMRVGYCIAHSTFVRTMMAVKQPYNIPVCSESVALAALTARPEIMKQVLAIVEERESMVKQVILSAMHKTRLSNTAVETIFLSSSFSFECKFRPLSRYFVFCARPGPRSEVPRHLGPPC
jgi:histidinol-phosphate aminotransferase